MKAKTNTEFAKKWTGCVEIKTGDNVAKLTSIQTDKEGKVKKFPGDLESIKVKLSELPKVAQRFIKPNMESKKFRVRLNDDGDEVETVTPYSGVFRGRATGLGPKTQEGDFKLIHRVYNEGTEKENRHDEFISIYEITSDKRFVGVELPAFYLHYKFEEDPENEGFTQYNTANTPQATQLHKLIAWAEVHGDILDEDVRWRDEDDGTILETLEERLLENDRDVNLVFEKGYIKSVQPVEDYEEVGDEDDVEKVPTKATVKRIEKVIRYEDDEPDFMKEPEPVKPVKSVGKKVPTKKNKKTSDEDDDL